MKEGRKAEREGVRQKVEWKDSPERKAGTLQMAVSKHAPAL